MSPLRQAVCFRDYTVVTRMYYRKMQRGFVLNKQRKINKRIKLKINEMKYPEKKSYILD